MVGWGVPWLNPFDAGKLQVLLHSMMLAQVPVHRLGTNKAPILPGKFLTDGNQAA